MDRRTVRYTFEHRLLPDFFYQEKEKFVSILLHNPESLYRLIDSIFEKEEVPNPYKPEDFKTEAAKLTEHVFMVKITFPEPENEPLCYCSYAFFDKAFEKVSYFCLEKGSDDDNDGPFVCAWDKEGNHLNYGHCSFEDHGDFLRCAKVHMKKYYS